MENPATLAARGASEQDHAGKLIGSENRGAPAEKQRPKSWRHTLPVHPAADMFPMMPAAALKVLGNDIKENGLKEPVVVWCEWVGDDKAGPYFLLDGRNRLAAMEMVGLRIFNDQGEFTRPVRARYVESAPPERPIDPYAYVISANLWRRHLTREQRCDLIDNLLKAYPNKSDRQIAETVKVSPTTVGTVRAKLEQSGDVSKLDTRIDTKGRAQPASKPEKKAHVFAIDIAAAIKGKGAPVLLQTTCASSSRIAAKPEPVKSGSEKALAEFKIAVDIWFARMDADSRSEAVNYAARKAAS